MEFTATDTTCRLCLQLLNGHFTILDEMTQSKLNSLLPVLDFSLTCKPMMCESCTESVAHCLNFKAKCMLNEDVVPMARNENNVEIFPQEFHENKTENDSINDSGDCNVCHFCLKGITCGSYVILDKDDIEMLPKYFPELGLGMMTRPVICVPCHKSLRGHFDFIRKCCRTEEKIIDFYNMEDENRQKSISLNNITNSILTTLIKNEENTVKMEVCIDKVNIDADCIIKEGNIKILKDEEDITTKDEMPSDMELLQYRSSQNPVRTAKQTHEYELCPYSAKTKWNSNCHGLSDKIMTYNCEKCTFKTRHKNSFRQHMSVHDNKEDVTVWTCHICGLQTKPKCNLVKHLRTHEKKLKGTTHNCTECGFESKHKKSLLRHMKRHKTTSEVTMHSCTECSFESKYKESIFRHMILHKKTSEVKMYTCAECDYQTKHKRNLQGHMLKHKSVSEGTIHKCTECSYETQSQNSLRKHMAGHKNDSVIMYKCTECTFESKHYGSFYKHINVHMNVDVTPSKMGIYTCTECEFKTRYKNGLLRHMVIHRQPSYKCLNCSFVSLDEPCIQKHVSIHRGSVEASISMDDC